MKSRICPCLAAVVHLGFLFSQMAFGAGVPSPIAAPTIARLSSTKAPEGGTVTIEGRNFLGVTFVGINGLPMKSFRILSASAIRAVLAPEATSGYVSVTGPVGVAQSPKPLQIGPSITDFSPASASPGDTITVSGYNLSAVNAVNVGAYGTSFTVVSNEELQLVVPARAVTALIGVHGLGYSFTSPRYLQIPLTLKKEYVLLKSDAANLKAATNGLSKNQFIPVTRLLTAVSSQINRYLSSESAGMADALNNLNSAIAVLKDSTLSTTEKSVQAEAFASAAAEDVNVLAQNYGAVTYRPGNYIFTVPTNVYSIYIAVAAGDGGNGGGCFDYTDDEGDGSWTDGDSGDSGQSVTGTYAVTPGQTLFVSVARGESGDCTYGNGGDGGGASVTGVPTSVSIISAAGGAGGEGAGCGCGDDGDNGQVTIYW